MFGYVKPAQGALRVCELERYRAAYCGVCHALAGRYGFWARMLLTYDFAFLALMLGGHESCDTKRRCVRHPLRGQRVSCEKGSLGPAADATILFVVWKLRDSARDGGFWARFFCKTALLVTKKAMRRAEAALPQTALAARGAMDELWRLEEERAPSLDRPADTFARMLAALCELWQGDESRVAYWILYHLGRWIYLADACDDLPRDAAGKAYNPVAERFELTDGRLTEEAREWMRSTLALSRNGALDALALWEGGAIPILENILALGLPAREKALLDEKNSRA